MAEQATQPTTAVAPEVSVEDRLTNLFGRTEQATSAPVPKAEPQPQPEEQEPAPEDDAQADASELTQEDIPEDDVEPVQQEPGDAFEIVHNGTQHKLSREETIKLAQQGFDYTTKTQALAEKARAVEASLQRAAEIEQVVPFIANEQAQLQSFKSQLDQYEKVDWVQLASEQPLEYPKYRAQYDLLVNEYNKTHHRLTQATNEVQRRRKEIQAQTLQQESAKLRELIPEWKSPERYQAEAKEIHSYLLSQGANPEAVAELSDALAVSIARKAMLYDKLLKSKGEKSKLLQTAPPVARPGAAQPPNAAARDQYQKLRQQVKKTGSVDDAARLFARLERSKK